MNKKHFYISAVILLIFLFSAFSFEYFSKVKQSLLFWAVIISVMGFLAGVAHLLKNQLLSIFKKKEYITPMLVIVSFLTTFLIGMCNPARSWFAGTNMLSENRNFLKTVIDVTLNNDYYFKDFPAKAKLNIILARMIFPDYIPSVSELENAGFDRNEFNKIFKSPGNSPDEKAISHIFLPEDIERFSELSEKAKRLGPFVYGNLYKKLDSLFIWYSSFVSTVAKSEQFAAAPFPSPPFNPGNLLKKETLNELELSSVLKTLIEKNPVWDSLSYSERENYLLKNRSDFLIEAGFHKKMSNFSGKKAEKFDKESAHRLTASFIKAYKGKYFSLKGSLRWIFRNIYKPISIAAMSLLLFFALSAVFRTFRFSSLESSVMIISAIFIFIVQAPAFIHTVEKLNSSEFVFGLVSWIKEVPLTAAIRGLVIGIGTGACLLSFKFITAIIRNNRNRNGL